MADRWHHVALTVTPENGKRRMRLFLDGKPATGLAFFLQSYDKRKQYTTGLTLDHVDAHHHLHLHPTVLGYVLALGKELPDNVWSSIFWPYETEPVKSNKVSQRLLAAHAAILGLYLGEARRWNYAVAMALIFAAVLFAFWDNNT